jgi:glycosyltransferase involved in cell wall biosynthesis
VSAARPTRVLFVFAWLVVGGEETEVRLLARHLDPARFRLDVVTCFRRPGMSEQTHRQLREAGISVDTTPYELSFEETVDHLAAILPQYDVVVACQAVADIHAALRRLDDPPPLIEHGGLVEEALRHPLDRTARYVGVCDSIRKAAASGMVGREEHALSIPSMVDVEEYDRARDDGARAAVRAELGIPDDVLLLGWVGRLDRKKRVEDAIAAVAMAAGDVPELRLAVIGGPDAFMPEYADELEAMTRQLGISHLVRFLGDRPDIPRLLAGLDLFVWLSEGEGMPHVVSEAGAARLPVIATRDNGTLEQIVDGVSGLFVPHRDPAAVAAAIRELARAPALRRALGEALRDTVDRRYRAEVVARRWESLIDEIVAESAARHPGAGRYAEGTVSTALATQRGRSAE